MHLALQIVSRKEIDIAKKAPSSTFAAIPQVAPALGGP